jgi:hypothetical protein
MINIRLDSNSSVDVDIIPNDCPYCHRAIDPRIIGHNYSANHLEILYKCTSLNCKRSFIGRYYQNYGDKFNFLETNIGDFKPVDFTETVKKISENFVVIYNESHFAEQNQLKQICGVGYRKALEFLIKDYLINKDPTKEEKVKKKFLGNCIKDDVTDPRIKQAAERAVWLGNDETHYVRVWEDKSLADLKKLIQLTLHWIEMEQLTDSFQKEMPDKKEK